MRSCLDGQTPLGVIMSVDPAHIRIAIPAQFSFGKIVREWGRFFVRAHGSIEMTTPKGVHEGANTPGRRPERGSSAAPMLPKQLHDIRQSSLAGPAQRRCPRLITRQVGRRATF